MKMKKHRHMSNVFKDDELDALFKDRRFWLVVVFFLLFLGFLLLNYPV